MDQQTRDDFDRMNPIEETLVVDRSKIRSHGDIDRLRGLSPNEIVVSGEFPGSIRNDEETESYLQHVLAPMLISARERCARCTGDKMSEENTDKPARTRAKDESPMARAKVAATRLRELDGNKGKLLLAVDRMHEKVSVLDEERAQFVLTLDDQVITILKAGGVL